MRRIKSPKPEIGLNHINNVVTLSEAAHAWCRGRSTLRYAIDRGYVTARRIGRDWLIAIPSLNAHYGAPTREIRR